MIDDYLGQYGLIAIFLVLAIVVPSSMLMASYMLSKLDCAPRGPTR